MLVFMTKQNKKGKQEMAFYEDDDTQLQTFQE